MMSVPCQWFLAKCQWHVSGFWPNVSGMSVAIFANFSSYMLIFAILVGLKSGEDWGEGPGLIFWSAM